MEKIALRNIKKSFGTGDRAVHALQGINLSIKEGEMVAVMGKSGSGKSTLLNVLGGLVQVDEGMQCVQPVSCPFYHTFLTTMNSVPLGL